LEDDSRDEGELRPENVSKVEQWGDFDDIWCAD